MQILNLCINTMYTMFSFLQKTEKKGDILVPKLPLLHLSSANIDRTGVYLMDAFDTIYMYVGSGAPQDFVRDVLDAPSFTAIPEGMVSKKFFNARPHLPNIYLTIKFYL